MTQDRRSAQTEKCISDMSKQVGKLAKAVEGLCGALGPAMKDSIKNELGPKMHGHEGRGLRREARGG